MTEEWNENPGDFAREWLRGTQRDETIYNMESRRGKFRLTTTAIEALTARIAQLEAERDAAREALKIANEPYWFYYGDDCSSERCRDSIYQCIDEDFEWDNRPEGDHVLLISGARPVPDIWVALHYYTEAEKDAQDSDDEYTFTEHKTKEEAEAYIRALKEPPHDV